MPSAAWAAAGAISSKTRPTGHLLVCQRWLWADSRVRRNRSSERNQFFSVIITSSAERKKECGMRREERYYISCDFVIRPMHVWRSQNVVVRDTLYAGDFWMILPRGGRHTKWCWRRNEMEIIDAVVGEICRGNFSPYVVRYSHMWASAKEARRNIQLVTYTILVASEI